MIGSSVNIRDDKEEILEAWVDSNVVKDAFMAEASDSVPKQAGGLHVDSDIEMSSLTSANAT